MDGLRVTKLEKVVRAHHGPLTERPYWRARVTLNGQTVPVTTRHGGCWRTDDGLREIVPEVAAELQRRVRRLERARGPRTKGTNDGN